LAESWSSTQTDTIEIPVIMRPHRPERRASD
jgi:hypothetical protein